jgi:hypothetical protein
MCLRYHMLRFVGMIYPLSFAQRLDTIAVKILYSPPRIVMDGVEFSTFAEVITVCCQSRCVLKHSMHTECSSTFKFFGVCGRNVQLYTC